MFRIIREEFCSEVTGPEWSNKVERSPQAVGLNLGQVLNKFPHQLSGGQLQRFLIARALLLDIQFLVADEIISMLDASTRIDVLNLLADLKTRGLSVLFITHDLSLGYYISELAVILYMSSITEMGATEKIFDDPLHPYTQMLMACVPRLDAKWQEVEVQMKAKQPAPAEGCAYFGRCPAADRALECGCVRPSLVEVEPEYFVACLRYGG